MAENDDNTKGKGVKTRRISRRTAIKTAGVLVGAGIAGVPGSLTRRAVAAEKPIRIGFQVHRTGIGAVYGRWYERTTTAAVKLINEMGGIAGRPVELVTEDDGTDPKRGAEVVEKLAVQHKVDFVYGTLFSHVVIASAPRAGELKIPLFVASEGYHVPSGTLNRYVFQPGITDVRSQVTSIVSWVLNNLGKKATMIFPDYAFGYDHRDFFGGAVREKGGTILAQLPIPPTETSFTKYFPRIPADTEVLYHVMVGPGVLTFVKEMGEHFGAKRPQIFGFIDSLEGVDIASPGLEFLEGTYFWEGLPRYSDGYPTPYEKFFRQRVGVNDEGASIQDPKDVSTYAHMFSCWETLFVIKHAVEQSGYRDRTPKDYKALIETLENFQWFNEGIQHPQGHKKFVGRIHQSFGQQFISEVRNRRLKVVHRTKIEDSLYPTEVDYTKQPL
ncbi:MAG: ABC transporter substrate-binding protein [Anaerolineales bacterium]|nr:ABC transporter substrate-binding protein [Anaerolineales bacterium]